MGNFTKCLQRQAAVIAFRNLKLTKSTTLHKPKLISNHFSYCSNFARIVISISKQFRLTKRPAIGK